MWASRFDARDAEDAAGGGAADHGVVGPLRVQQDAAALSSAGQASTQQQPLQQQQQQHSVCQEAPSVQCATAGATQRSTLPVYGMALEATQECKPALSGPQLPLGAVLVDQAVQLQAEGQRGCKRAQHAAQMHQASVDHAALLACLAAMQERENQLLQQRQVWDWAQKGQVCSRCIGSAGPARLCCSSRCTSASCVRQPSRPHQPLLCTLSSLSMRRSQRRRLTCGHLTGCNVWLQTAHHSSRWAAAVIRKEWGQRSSRG